MPAVRFRTLRDLVESAVRRVTSRNQQPDDATAGTVISAPETLRPEPAGAVPSGSHADDRPEPAWAVGAPLTADGVNVVGYLDKQLGLGDAGRRIVSLLADDHVPISPLAFGASPSPMVAAGPVTNRTIAYRNTIAVVAADQMPVLHDWHPEIFASSERMIGYCFWELSRLSTPGARGVGLLDEVWVATTFIRSVFERLGTVPVRHVPLPVAEPEPSTRPRSSFPPLVGCDGRIVFGVTFDYYSVLERKNPLAAVDAFMRAFSEGEGPVLVLKTLNAPAHPAEHGRLIDRIGDRNDVVAWDAHLSDADQFAFLSHLDVLVSLHRGEGLGKHLAEAMWLGVPVIATGYSGNLDFMDDFCSRLVGYELIDVEGGGTIYPSGTQWADPDIADAADAMRELAGDDARRHRFGGAARDRMHAGPTGHDVAATICGLLDL